VANVKGRNVQVDVALTTGTLVPVLSVSKASPAIVTAPSHGLAQWSAGTLIGISGMPDLDGQGIIVGAPYGANSFGAPGLDTRAFRGLGGSGFVKPVTSWATLSECTSYELSDGTVARLRATTILHGQERTRPSGLLPSQVLALNLIPQTVPSRQTGKKWGHS